MSDWGSRRARTAADQQHSRDAYKAAKSRVVAEAVTDRGRIEQIAAEELAANELPADQARIDFVTDAVLTTPQKSSAKHVRRGVGQLFGLARDLVKDMKRFSVPGYLNPPESAVHAEWATDDDWWLKPVLDPAAESMLRQMFTDLHPLDEGGGQPPRIRGCSLWLKMQPVPANTDDDAGQVVVMAGNVPVGVFTDEDAARIWPTLRELQVKGNALRVDCWVHGTSYADMSLKLLLPGRFDL